METNAKYVTIGAATAIGAALIMLFAMWISTGSYRGGWHDYEIVFDDPVRGLSQGGEVRFNGIKVGEVRQLEIDPENAQRVIARVRVSANVPVREDSEARLEPIGLTGVTLIQLSAGTGDVIRPGFGATPRIHGRGSQIDVLFDQSEDIVERARLAMANLGNLLTEENIEKVSRIVANLETISEQLADRRSVIARSGETAAAMTQAASELALLSRQLRADMADLDVAIGEINAAAGVAAGEALPELARAAAELRRASGAIGRVASDLEENPSVLTPRPSRPVVELPR